MKKTILALTVAAILVNPVAIFAQNGQAGVKNTNQEGVSTPAGNQVQNQNVVKTQNQGEDAQLMVATQHMEQLMEMEGAGQPVKTIVQEQIQAQSQIQAQLTRLETKTGLMKGLFGPDFGAIKNLNQQMEQNRLRIQQLQQLAAQVKNQADQTQIQTAIQALVSQNTALQARIQAEEKTFSLFGWLVRLFAK